MISSILIFTTVFLSSISIHASNMGLASKTAVNISDRAKSEYHRHACGRAIAAIKNFNVIANRLHKAPKNPGHAISKTFSLIQTSLITTYGNIYEVQGDSCIDPKTRRPVVKAYRRGPDYHLDSPNFSYRFL
jgi:hypothetical protein